ncbi:MAG: hypothetical protein IT340_22130 [Chloroflexi bacterium]|nr:hypothetical protein [Chloroflexota bacterium]
MLRLLTDAGKLRLGVCWLLTADDDRADGGFVRYLADPARWRAHDPPLFDGLQAMVAAPGGRDVRRVEQAGLLPDTRF